MLRIFTTLALAMLLPLPAWAQYGHGHGGGYADPSAFGQQTQASIHEDDVVVFRRTDTFNVFETQYREERRTRVREVDGEKREEVYTVKVPVVLSKQVASEFQSRVTLDKIQAFDMAGKPVEADRIKEALKDEATVLLATRKVPGYYLSIYKPETLLLVVEQHHLYGAPMPYTESGEGGEVTPPPPDAAPDAPPVIAPAPAPAAPAAAPVAADPKPLPGMAPRVNLAKVADGTLVHRTYLKDVTTQTAMREVEVDGKKQKAPFSIEIESVTNTETKYPQDTVKAVRADGKPVTADELAELLSSDRCVLTSADGQPVDKSFLKIVRPDALIVVAPMPQPPALPLPAGAPAGAPALVP